MRSDYLRRAAKRMVVTKEQVEAVQQRLGDKARQIEEQVERSKITTEFLNKTYGI